MHRSYLLHWMIDLHDCTYISPTSISVYLCIQYLQLRKINSTGIPHESAGTSFDPKILYLTVFESICTESNHRLFTFLYSLIEINLPQNIFYYN